MKDYSYAKKVITESRRRLADKIACGKTSSGRKNKTYRSVPARLPLKEVFDELCDKFSSPNGWFWRGQINRNGYPTYGRPVYQLLFPEVLPFSGKRVCHHCDNKLCVNPHHMYVGTPRSNTEDRYKKTNLSGKQRHENFLARRILLE